MISLVPFLLATAGLPVAGAVPTGDAQTEQAGTFVAPEPLLLAQLRFEQRVIIRIPMQRSAPAVLAAPARNDDDDDDDSPGYAERKIGKCVAINSLAGVRVGSDRFLNLFTRDRRIIRAELEKSCPARNFYSGFYIEKTRDGNLCVDRDLLHSRSGAKCEIERLRELVRE